MLRAMGWTLRQRRYRALAVLMLVIAVACVSIGTFELHRYREKVQGNDHLRANAHATPVALSPRLVPLTTAAAAPDDATKFRRVTATGRWDLAGQRYDAEQNQGGHQGFWVLTPLRTTGGTLLVARGFVAATAQERRPSRIAAPPGGVVRVTGRLFPGQSTDDGLGELGHGEITSINAVQQSSRLGTPVYRSFLMLAGGSAGAAGLVPLPQPVLSNPTGGAGEIQLLSYVVQWYVFALLALAAPFFFARNDVKDAQRRFLGIDPDGGEFDAVRAAPTAAAIGAGSPAENTATLELRASGTLTRTAPEPVRRAERLANRYGRSLGPDPVDVPDDLVPPAHVDPVRRDTSSAPWRSADGYHGSYNDHLWRLALADGEAPDVDLGDAPPDDGRKVGDGLKVYGRDRDRDG